MSSKEKVKFLDKLEDEALDYLKDFKEHPIKSIVIALIVVWGIKKLVKFFKED